VINEHGERNDTDMKNPMRKRIWREIKGETGKYIVIFVFMVALIGVASGFFVADVSLKDAYDNSFEKYNIEDGNFKVAQVPDDDVSRLSRKRTSSRFTTISTRCRKVWAAATYVSLLKERM